METSQETPKELRTLSAMVFSQQWAGILLKAADQIEQLEAKVKQLESESVVKDNLQNN
jgi:hypothetical protein